MPRHCSSAALLVISLIAITTAIITVIIIITNNRAQQMEVLISHTVRRDSLVMTVTLRSLTLRYVNSNTIAANQLLCAMALYNSSSKHSANKVVC
jgi:putative exporter of polyketide antibiotics